MSNWSLLAKSITFSLFLTLLGCYSQPKVSMTENKMKHSTVDVNKIRKSIEQSPLQELWYFHVAGNDVRKMYLCDNLLLLESSEHKLTALNRKNGITEWVCQLEHPVDFPPSVFEDKIYLFSFGKIYGIGKNTGSVFLEKDLNFLPTSPAFVNARGIFAGGDEFLYFLDSDTAFQQWRYRTTGEIRATPRVNNNLAFVPNSNGKLYVIDLSNKELKKTWGQGGTFTTLGENTTAVTVVESIKPPVIYLPSKDFNLYSLDRTTGALKWKFVSGGEITQPALFHDNSVYITSEKNLGKDLTLFSLQPENGKERWSYKRGKQVCFQGHKHLWLLSQNKELVGVHPEKGTVGAVYKVPFFDHILTHLAKEKEEQVGYFATQDGFVFALTEK